jgi:hypothetical protein
VNQQELFWVFFVIWGVLGLASWAFYEKASVAVRREWHPWIVVGFGALFVVATYALMPQIQTLWFVIPAVLLISWLNYTNTKFCAACGATYWVRDRSDTVQTCPKCAATGLEDLGGAVVDMRRNRTIFKGSMIIFMGIILYTIISSQGVLPFLPTLPETATSFLMVLAVIVFVVGLLVCRCPRCGKFLSGGDGLTTDVPECPRCHAVLK